MNPQQERAEKLIGNPDQQRAEEFLRRLTGEHPLREDEALSIRSEDQARLVDEVGVSKPSVDGFDPDGKPNPSKPREDSIIDQMKTKGKQG